MTIGLPSIRSMALLGTTLFSQLLWAPDSRAEQPFYQGKTINVEVGGGAGGNADTDARLIMRYMAPYIAGNPRVIVRNLESGNGGITSINHFGEVSRRDGTEVLVGTVSYTAQLLNDPALRVKYSQLEAVGGFGEAGIIHIRKDMPPGINSVTDLFKVTTPVKSAGYSLGHDVDLNLDVAMDLLQLPHQDITGFRNSGAAHLAELQGVVQMGYDSASGYRTNIEPVLFKPGVSIPLWQAGIPMPDGSMKRSASFPDLPTLLDVYKMKFGADATPPKDLWEAYLLITTVHARLVRGIFLPPGAPPEALAALREAWDKTTKDPKFIAECEKKYRVLPDFTSGADADAFLRSDITADPTLINLLQHYAGR
jgi:tripartite-type tricarboxylate transporter receptor subunit TctC